jgi:hypothetical protein
MLGCIVHVRIPLYVIPSKSWNQVPSMKDRLDCLVELRRSELEHPLRIWIRRHSSS